MRALWYKEKKKKIWTNVPWKEERKENERNLRDLWKGKRMERKWKSKRKVIIVVGLTQNNQDEGIKIEDMKEKSKIWANTLRVWRENGKVSENQRKWDQKRLVRIGIKMGC